MPSDLDTAAIPAYAAARIAAPKIRAHFERHISPAPDIAAIEVLIEAAFWGSLRREEGFTPRISLALVAPHEVPAPAIFERALPLAAQPLAKLAPAVERPGIHLGVSRFENGFCVWGATRTLPDNSLVLEVVAPGLLVVKHSRGEESGKFVNVAVLQGEEIKIVDQNAAEDSDCPDLITSLLGFETRYGRQDAVNPLIQLAVSMRAHGRGGALLVVPANDTSWRDSIAHPVQYALDPAFTLLSNLLSGRPTENRRRWADALQRAIDGIAGLTAVDGATVITHSFDVLAFGAKIVRKRGAPHVPDVIRTEPIEGSAPEIVDPGQLGGTRHMSAAQFISDQRDALALVASQDGRFTVFAWSPCEDRVHAHRIESLLL